jgi:UPF0755 protein
MKKRKILVVFILVFSILLTSFLFYAYQIVYTPNILAGENQGDRFVLIPKGAKFADVQKILFEGGIVQDPVSFSFLARLMDYDKSVKPGRYGLTRGMSNLSAIRTLRSGKQVPVSITFNNVRLISELAPKITRNLAMSPDDFSEALDDFIDDNDAGFNEQTIAAMFIPNSYNVFYDTSPEELVARMKYEYDEFWDDDRRAKAERIGLTPLEVSTLASIVQAETRHKSEAPRIAGLYINRLKRDMLLQADPTVVFAVGDFTLKRVLDKHKEVKSPYNTYMHAGLPPGPINMPELYALEAVLDFERNNYVYMCAREDFSGYHNFTASYSEHVRNASRYQTALSREQAIARRNRR